MTSAVAGLVMILGLLGAFGSGSDGALTAPHDTAEEAARGILPGAHVAVHGNVQGAMAALDGLLREVEGLKVVTRDKALREGVVAGRAMLGVALAQLATELGVDLRRDVGSVTLSFEFPSADEVRMLLRARGNLAATRIDDALGSADSTYGGVRLYPIPDAPELADHVVALLDSTTLVVGPREAVHHSVARKPLKADPKRASGRLASSVRKGTRGFIYLAAPTWAAEGLGESPSMRAAADLLSGISHLVYTVDSSGAHLRVTTSSPAAGRRVGHLLRASAAILSMVDAATDALVHGLLGIAPLLPDEELDPLLRDALTDEAAMEELGQWVKGRFGGRATVKVGGKGSTVDMELSNPASIGSLMLPVLGGAGAALWWSAREGSGSPEPADTFD